MKLKKNFFSKIILVSPIVEFSGTYKEFLKIEKKGSLPKSFVEWFSKLYIPIQTNLYDPRLSPFWASKKKLSNLHNTDIIFSDSEIFREQIERFISKLTRYDVAVKRIILANEYHGALWHNKQVTDIFVTIASDVFGTKKIPRSINSKPANTDGDKSPIKTLGDGIAVANKKKQELYLLKNYNQVTLYDLKPK